MASGNECVATHFVSGILLTDAAVRSCRGFVALRRKFRVARMKIHSGVIGFLVQLHLLCEQFDEGFLKVRIAPEPLVDGSKLSVKDFHLRREYLSRAVELRTQALPLRREAVSGVRPFQILTSGATA